MLVCGDCKAPRKLVDGIIVTEHHSYCYWYEAAPTQSAMMAIPTRNLATPDKWGLWSNEFQSWLGPHAGFDSREAAIDYATAQGWQMPQ